MTLIVVEAVAGLSRQQCITIGKDYKDGAIDARTKNEAVLTGKDSLFQTFHRAMANYESNYTLAQTVAPPSAFYVDGGGDRIALSWEVAETADIVPLVMLLLSQSSAYCTGSVLVADGGLTLGLNGY